MKELLNKYREQFREPFPLMLVLGMEEDEICEIIKTCIESKTPYEVEDEDKTY